MAKRIFLIDGTAFVYRSFFAIKGLTGPQGQPTNAVFGFTRVMLKIMREMDPSHIAVVFDAPGKTFRNEMYPDYKATRPPTPKELIEQIPWVDKVVQALNIKMIRIPGVEADDVLGTLARKAKDEGFDAVIVTGDKDMFQLVSEGVSVFDPNRGDSGQYYKDKDVVEKMGVTPKQVIDFLALMGDSSDNIPGVPGIGKKTAAKLLEKYGSIEGVYENLDDLKGKQRQNIEENKDKAFLSRDLATIKTDVEVDTSIEECQTLDFDNSKLAELFEELGFRSLSEEFMEPQPPEETDYQLVLDMDTLERVINEMRTAGTFAIDTETTSTDSMKANLVGISVSCKKGTGYYIPVAHTPEALMLREHPEDLFPQKVVEQLSKEDVLDAMRPLLADPAIAKVGQNIKYDINVLKRAGGINIAGIVMDTMVASYLTAPSLMRHNLDELSLQHLKRKTIPIASLIGKGSKAVTFDTVQVDKACEYACEDADITFRLAEVFQTLLRERDLENLFREVELPLIGVLARMETAGIAIQRAVFDSLLIEIESRIKELERDIFDLVGETFNINSPKQLQEILFDKMGLKPIRKTKTGYSTDVTVLEELSRVHVMPKMVLEYRTLEKLRGTYVEALPKLVNPETNRIHTSFNQAVAATGRLSSSDPNLQNIPVRTEIGRRIRQGFIPGEENLKLISADYSQIELRVLAHLSKDKHLVESFEQDADIHRDTAARVFNVDPQDVTVEMRREAKAVNFGVVYGISAFGLAKNLGISNSEASFFIEQYFNEFPGVKKWIDSTIEQARERGFVTTILNRRRYLPELNSPNTNIRRGAERIATNTPVQGSAADIIKVAMIRLDEALKNTEARLLLQVHDELLVETPQENANEIASQMRQIMENAIELDVQLKVDVGIGDNWDDIH